MGLNGFLRVYTCHITMYRYEKVYIEQTLPLKGRNKQI